MKKQLCILFLILTSHVLVNAQDTSFPQRELMLLDGDSIPTYGIPLKEVVLFQPLRFKTRLELKRYLILRRKTLKVYPYAKLAADRLTILNERLDNLDNKRSRKKYLKRMEKFIYEEFEDELKKFSRSEGKILIRLST